MRIPKTDHLKRGENFFIFRFVYNEQLKTCDDCNTAFNRAKDLFYHQQGFYPYGQLEEYLLELYLFNNAYYKRRN